MCVNETKLRVLGVAIEQRWVHQAVLTAQSSRLRHILVVAINEILRKWKCTARPTSFDGVASLCSLNVMQPKIKTSELIVSVEPPYARLWGMRTARKRCQAVVTWGIAPSSVGLWRFCTWSNSQSGHALLWSLKNNSNIFSIISSECNSQLLRESIFLLELLSQAYTPTNLKRPYCLTLCIHACGFRDCVARLS